jgi:hypothetical protein
VRSLSARRSSRATWRARAVLATALGVAAAGSAGAASGLFNLALLADNRERIETVQDAGEQALPRLTRGTPFANRWVINPTDASASKLRLVLFRSNGATKADGVTRAYTGGCETFVPYKLIICDVQAFEDLMHHWGFDRRTDLGGRDWPIDRDPPVRPLTVAEQRETLQQLVTWVLGHEIGHITQKSTETVADVAPLLSDVPGLRLTQKTEVLADEHVLHGSGLDTSERDDLRGFVTAALNAELHLKYCPTRDVVLLCRSLPAGVGIIYDYNSAKKLDIDASKDHPEFLLRLIRLLELQHSQGDCESDGLCVLLKAVVERVRAVNQH